ncbi:MAG TPA: sugar phosphate isomerase/epimerase family protein [Sedimentisphaerales bacterium]|nr:sugar phosphate isomerase/epimerase family protein [Sedimentisphaerales bacterium]
MRPERQSRRNFIKLAGAGVAASLAGRADGSAMNRSRIAVRTVKPQFELGLASYTLRKFNLDETLAMTKRVGLKYICFKSFHLPLESSDEQIRQVVQKVKDAGLILYGGGVISMNKQAEVDRAFEYAKAAGMKVIVASPSPELLDLVDKKVKEYDIKVAIHNHGPGDKVWPTPDQVYERIKQYDERIGLCHDIGHTQRLGIDPVASTEKVGARLLDVHIKDVTGPTAKDHGCEIGRGVIDIPGFLRMLIKINYAGVVSFEYEENADDPLAGLAESVGYVKGALAAIQAPAVKDMLLVP